jgi:hypothetical protein
MARVRGDATAPTCVEHSVDERIVLLTLVAGTFLAPLDSSIVNIALPAIAADFGVRIAAAGWVATAYVLTTASLVLTMGRLSDILGLRGSTSPGSSCSERAPPRARLRRPSAGSSRRASSRRSGRRRCSRRDPRSSPGRSGPGAGDGRSDGSACRYRRALRSVRRSAGARGVPSGGSRSSSSTSRSRSAWRSCAALLPEDCTQSEPFDLAGAVLAALTLTSLLLLALSEIDRSGLASPNVLGALRCRSSRPSPSSGSSARRRIRCSISRLFSERGLSAGVSPRRCSYASLFAVTFTMPFYLLKGARHRGAVRRIDPDRHPDQHGDLLPARRQTLGPVGQPRSVDLRARLAGVLARRR